MGNSQRDLFAAGGASVAALTSFLFCADGSVIGVYKVPGFIIALEGVDTSLIVGVFCTGQPNWCTPRQTKLLNNSQSINHSLRLSSQFIS